MSRDAVGLQVFARPRAPANRVQRSATSMLQHLLRQDATSERTDCTEFCIAARDGRVVLQLARPLDYLTFTAAEAEAFARALIESARAAAGPVETETPQ